ncbi:MAG TPA: ABC transporter ATP-binding protein, partial [Ktedonobacter sp.]|nr:ABC transporter ATP-binding protein [Ktedonobacter sp.]
MRRFLLLNREFTVVDEYRYNRSNPARWIASHLLRYKAFVLLFMTTAILANVLNASIPALTGVAFNAVLAGSLGQLITISLSLLLILLLTGVSDISARLSAEVIGKRVARDARDELYLSLLSKDQTFHNRQRVGDVMARATNDIDQLNNMLVPGFDTIFDSFTALVVPMVFTLFINPQLLLTPLVFTVVFLITLRRYSRKLEPVSNKMREQFGTMNAVLTEAVSGVEVVKATAQEEQEKRKFRENATMYRDYFVKNGLVQGQ